MNQTQHNELDSVEAYRQHDKNAELESEFGISWGEVDVGAKMGATGTAVREGARKLEMFFKTVILLAITLAIVGLGYIIGMVAKTYIKAKS